MPPRISEGDFFIIKSSIKYTRSSIKKRCKILQGVQSLRVCGSVCLRGIRSPSLFVLCSIRINQLTKQSPAQRRNARSPPSDSAANLRPFTPCVCVQIKKCRKTKVFRHKWGRQNSVLCVRAKQYADCLIYYITEKKKRQAFCHFSFGASFFGGWVNVVFKLLYCF